MGGEREEETVEHLVTECEAYNTEREKLEKEMMELIGIDAWEKIRNKEDRGIAWLLDLDITDEEKSREKMHVMKKFLKKIWKKRELMEKQRKERRVEEKHLKDGDGRQRHGEERLVEEEAEEHRSNRRKNRIKVI